MTRMGASTIMTAPIDVIRTLPTTLVWSTPVTGVNVTEAEMKTETGIESGIETETETETGIGRGAVNATAVDVNRRMHIRRGTTGTRNIRNGTKTAIGTTAERSTSGNGMTADGFLPIWCAVQLLCVKLM
jgi:hypothetical protein